MLNQLPYELICEIFTHLPTPGDYFNMSICCRRLCSFGSSHHCRTRFVKAYFGPERSSTSASSKSRSAFNTICRLIVTSGVKPVDHSFSATAPGIGSRTFCDFYQNAATTTNATDRIALVDLLAAHCERGEWTVPALPMDPTQDIILSAKATARHLTQDGPRRVFVDAKMHSGNSGQQHHHDYRCVFHLIDTIVAFDNQGVMRKGKIVYRDGNVLDTTDWCAVFESCQMKTESAAQGSNNNKRAIFGSSHHLRPAPKLGRRITPAHWEPCQLRSFENCRVKTKIDKGNLLPGDHIDRINMYEHGEGDMICLEFLNTKQRAFLLLSEHSVRWDVA